MRHMLLSCTISPLIPSGLKLWYFAGVIAKWYDQYQFPGTYQVVIEDNFDETATVYMLCFQAPWGGCSNPSQTNFLTGYRYKVNIKALSNGIYITPAFAYCSYENSCVDNVTFTINFLTGAVTLNGRGQNTSNQWGWYSSSSNFKTIASTSYHNFNSVILPRIRALGYVD